MRKILKSSKLRLALALETDLAVALNERFYPFSSGRRLITTAKWKKNLEFFRALAAETLAAAGLELSASSEFRLVLRHPERFDVDALPTFVLNALQGTAYKNDRQVRELLSKAEPRANVSVELWTIARTVA
jgi:hypothetical protein